MKASGWLQSAVTTSSYYVSSVTFVPTGESFLCRRSYFSSFSVVSRAFSALCVYSTFGRHPHGHPYATYVPNFLSVAPSVAKLDHGEKSRTQSLSHPPSLCREPKLSLRKSEWWSSYSYSAEADS